MYEKRQGTMRLKSALYTLVAWEETAKLNYLARFLNYVDVPTLMEDIQALYDYINDSTAREEPES